MKDLNMIKVEQRHRDAASDACEFIYRAAKLTAMREGKIDDHGIIQAFARYEAEHIRTFLENPPKHDFWGAGEPGCPKDIKVGNGEIHTLRCKKCGVDSPPDQICRAVLRPTPVGTEPQFGDTYPEFLAALPAETKPKASRVEFEREERYIVIKRKYLTALQETSLRDDIARLGISTVECVVVESDWPEYETVWKIIEDRCTTQHMRPEPADRGAIPVAYRCKTVTYDGKPIPGYSYYDGNLSNPLNLPREYLYTHPPTTPPDTKVEALQEASAQIADAKAAKWRKAASKHTRKDGRQSDCEQSDLARAELCDEIAAAIRSMPLPTTHE